MKRTILNPLSSLAESAQKFSGGDYTIRARTDKADEIGMLTQTFNEMAENVGQRSRELETSRQELAGWNLDLEYKTQRRTKELSTLNAIVTTISQSLDLYRILNDALTKTLTVMDIEAGVVHLLDEKADRLTIIVHQGDVYLYPSVARMPVEDHLQKVNQGEEKTSYEGFTSREREILLHIAEDRKNKEIADLLSISIRTVQAHRTNLMDKIGAHDRTELVKYAIRKEITDL